MQIKYEGLSSKLKLIDNLNRIINELVGFLSNSNRRNC